MEDYLAFVETHSLLVLCNLPWTRAEASVRATFETQWTHLRKSALYFLRYREGQHTPEQLDENAAHALSYAGSAEKVCCCYHKHIKSFQIN